MARHYFTVAQARTKWLELCKLAEQGEEVIIISRNSTHKLKLVFDGEATQADRYFSTIKK